MRGRSLEYQVGVAAHVARLAGEALRSSFGQVQQIRHKGEINLVTETDELVERLVVQELARHFPTDRVLAEEGTTGGDDPERLWIIDPLDGTTNFAHSYPVFAVSIALEVRGTVVAGVVYQPVLDELFTATRGGGARLNGEPIRVSATHALGQSLLCSGFSYDRREIAEALGIWDRLLLRAQAVRRDGAAAIDLCYVGMGRFDGFWERSLHPWDVAAATLVIEEAGGRLSDYRGGPFDIRGREIVASNGHIHDQLLTAIGEGSEG